MNRAERRAALKKARRSEMAQKLQSGPMQIGHGHSDTHVLIQFNRMAQEIILNEEQAEDFMAAMKISLEKLRQHKLKLAGAH
jgi:hypothetical protein